jgi:hypothetical protein
MEPEYWANRGKYVQSLSLAKMHIVSQRHIRKTNPEQDVLFKRMRKRILRSEKYIDYIRANLFDCPSKQRMKRELEEEFNININLCEFLLYFEASKILEDSK